MSRSGRSAIPATLDETVADLNGIGALLNAKGWERAAIVYAFTEDGQGSNQHGSSFDEKSSKLSISDAADLNITGLRTRDTIRRYRTIWAEHPVADVAPGVVGTPLPSGLSTLVLRRRLVAQGVGAVGPAQGCRGAGQQFEGFA